MHKRSHYHEVLINHRYTQLRNRRIYKRVNEIMKNKKKNTKQMNVNENETKCKLILYVRIRIYM